MKRIHLIFLFVFFAFLAEAQTGIQYKMVVAQDGSGDFTTIQEAIDATKAFPDKRITIFLKNGIYREKVRVPSWNNKLSLIGEDVEKTIITWDDYFDKINRGRNSTFFTWTLLVEADDFYAENLTIENSADPVRQAVALHVEGNRWAFKNCRFPGSQDTLYLTDENCHQFFQNCIIEGTTDFIFGSVTAVFQDCKVVSKADSYITAASTTEGKKFGFFFIECDFIADKGVEEVYLGRPWRNHAKTVILNSYLAEHIRPEGWQNWSKPQAETTAFYAEYNNSGPGAKIQNRVNWSHVLTQEKAKKYTAENILGDWVVNLNK